MKGIEVAGEEIPLRLTQFISAHISSVEQILVLQVLREDPSRFWQTEELAIYLRSANTSIERRLDQLYENGLLNRNATGPAGTHHYNPSSAENAELIGLLLDTYQEKSTRVIEMIYSPSPSAIRAFADAFKFRK